MKKAFYTVLFLLCALVAGAQLKFGVEGGAVYSNPRSNVNTSFENNWNPGIGLRVGGLVDVKITSGVFFRTGLSFEQKRHSFFAQLFSSSGVGIEMQEIYTLNYLTLPLKICYNADGKNGGVLIGAGPEISYGLLANINNHVRGGDANNIKFPKNDFGFGTGETEIARLDVGVNFSIGYQFKSGFGTLFMATYGTKNLKDGNDNMWYNRTSGIVMYYLLK